MQCLLECICHVNGELPVFLKSQGMWSPTQNVQNGCSSQAESILMELIMSTFLLHHQFIGVFSLSKCFSHSLFLIIFVAKNLEWNENSLDYKEILFNKIKQYMYFTLDVDIQFLAYVDGRGDRYFEEKHIPFHEFFFSILDFLGVKQNIPRLI